MSWMEKALHEKRRKSASEQAEKLYEELWKEITDRLDEGRQKTPIQPFVIQYPPTTFDRNINFSDPRKPGNPKTLHVRLSADRLAVETSGHPKSLKLKINFCNDEICLIHEGETVSVAKAVELILKPFFFDEA